MNLGPARNVESEFSDSTKKRVLPVEVADTRELTIQFPSQGKWLAPSRGTPSESDRRKLTRL